jgi:hypothetical protein
VRLETPVENLGRLRSRLRSSDFVITPWTADLLARLAFDLRWARAVGVALDEAKWRRAA